MKPARLQLLAIILFICCCGFHSCLILTPDHQILVWNHSDYDLMVVSGGTQPRRFHDRTIRPGDKGIVMRYRSDRSMRNGDTLRLKILLGDSLIYRQDTFSTELWETRKWETLAPSFSYTLHVFNASTRQPAW